MYDGNNPTALHSMEWLADALLSLMEEQDYSKITVKNICNKAGLSRQTFYNFFIDKDDIIRFCIHKYYSEMVAKLAEKTPVTLADITRQLMETLSSNQKLIRLIVLHGLDYLLELELVSVIRVFAERMSPTPIGEMDQYATAFLSGAITHMVLYWFKVEKPVAQEQLSELLYCILTGNYFQIRNE